MKKTIKIISCFAILAVMATSLGQTASAQTIKEKDAVAKSKYQQTKTQYQNVINFYKSARQDFLNARTKYQQFKNADNKKALEDKAKSFLEKTVTSLIKKLETVKAFVSNNRAIQETERQEIIAEIDQDIAWLNARLPKITTATQEQIKEEAKTIQQYWKTNRVKTKRITGEILAARINFIIAKSENSSAKVSAKIEELKIAGKDTAQLEAWLTTFNQKISLAKEKYALAKEKFQEIKGDPGADLITEISQADQLFKAGNQFIKEANEYIKQAHTQLVQIVKEIKKMGATVEATGNVVPTE